MQSNAGFSDAEALQLPVDPEHVALAVDAARTRSAFDAVTARRALALRGLYPALKTGRHAAFCIDAADPLLGV